MNCSVFHIFRLCPLWGVFQSGTAWSVDELIFHAHEQIHGLLMEKAVKEVLKEVAL